uniref:Uncharacterized protein n=1 Tax=Rhizophora mucronata TaxID=61149 RepID=A0A2P2N4W7_RHIMU
MHEDSLNWFLKFDSISDRIAWLKTYFLASKHAS